MARYCDPETAPRDGTIIVGLFERAGKRPFATLAAFDLEGASTDEIDPSWPAWQREMAERHALRVRTDPLSFFRPLNDDADTGLGFRRMIGWRSSQ